MTTCSSTLNPPPHSRGQCGARSPEARSSPPHQRRKATSSSWGAPRCMLAPAPRDMCRAPVAHAVAEIGEAFPRHEHGPDTTVRGLPVRDRVGEDVDAGSMRRHSGARLQPRRPLARWRRWCWRTSAPTSSGSSPSVPMSCGAVPADLLLHRGKRSVRFDRSDAADRAAAARTGRRQPTSWSRTGVRAVPNRSASATTCSQPPAQRSSAARSPVSAPRARLPGPRPTMRW